MGWRESCAALVELFPQVDARLIKGAALEHGDDVGAAAEYILTEIIAPDEENGDNEFRQNRIHLSPSSSPEHHEQSCVQGDDLSRVCHLESNPYCELSNDHLSEKPISGGFNHGERNVVADIIGQEPYLSESPGVDSGFVRSPIVQEDRQMLLSKFSEELHDENLAYSAQGQQIDSEDGLDWSRDDCNGVKQTSYTWKAQPEIPNVGPEATVLSSGVCAYGEGDARTTGETKAEKRAAGVSDSCCVQRKAAECKLEVSEVATPSNKSADNQVDSGFDLTSGQTMKVKDLVGMDETSPRDSEKLDLINVEALSMENQHWRDCDKILDYPMFDSVVSSPTTYENESTGLGSAFDTMLSVVSMDGSDGLDWGSIQSSSLRLARMETLDNLVEQAQSDKDVLINSIEEIRSLRLKTDQAEHRARQSKEEADCSGLEVLSQVEEMRKMLARAREANAVHAGEIYGEKAVLATEARELRTRLLQVKAEKAKALAALNEIKASLQARIDIANQEQEIAEEVKDKRGKVAREVLAEEEVLVAKVAQESRDLDAEAEACTKLREFLIERGSIVDALQGEVAVLCEDAEALKKDLDGMSLSCGGGYVHMLSSAPSDVFTTTCSKLSKLSEVSCGLSESLDLLDGRAISFPDESGPDESGLISEQSVPPVHKVQSDKKLRSPLPSLLKALSSSQDRSCSSSSLSVHSSTGTSNSPTWRNAVRGNSDFHDQFLDAEGLMGVMQDTSEPTLPMSADGALVSDDGQKIQMAMFPGEEVELEYSSNNNMDVFRSHNTSNGEVGSSTDDEDWQLLDPLRAGNEVGSGSSSSSSDGLLSV